MYYDLEKLDVTYEAIKHWKCTKACYTNFLKNMIERKVRRTTLESDAYATNAISIE